MQIQYVQEKQIVFRMISGVVQIKLFLGDQNPENVVRMYHKYINGWTMHPFW